MNQALQEKNTLSDRMVKLMRAGADFIDVQAFGDPNSSIREQMQLALQYAKECPNLGLASVCIYDPVANILIWFPKEEGFLGIDDLEEKQLREYLNLPADHAFQGCVRATYQNNERAIAFR